MWVFYLNGRLCDTCVSSPYRLGKYVILSGTEFKVFVSHYVGILKIAPGSSERAVNVHNQNTHTSPHFTFINSYPHSGVSEKGFSTSEQPENINY